MQQMTKTTLAKPMGFLSILEKHEAYRTDVRHHNWQ